MENHPIPQDVTGFQFKLIGNMTVKQFAYLATGVVLAYIFFQLPINFLIKIPLCAFFAILGIGLAFLPISGRPMDLMIGNYIKALFRPTQFVYEKRGKDLYFANKPVLLTKVYKNNFNPMPNDKLKAYLQNKALEKKNLVSSLKTGSLSSPQIPQITFKPNQTPVPAATNIPLAPQPTVQPVTQNTYVPPVPQRPTLLPTPPPPAARFIKNTGMPKPPETPNLITGIVKDPRGNPLSNILVEVTDREGSPVRAFKTNEVGRFASATPLMNGDYTIRLEDPKGQNRFEAKTINVIGQIIAPIEAISIDTREELRRSLFSTNN